MDVPTVLLPPRHHGWPLVGRSGSVLLLALLAATAEVVAAVAVFLAGGLLLAAATLVLALVVIVAAQALEAILVLLALVVLVALFGEDDVMQRAEPQQGKSAARGSPDHAAAIRLLADSPGQIIEAVGIHDSSLSRLPRASEHPDRRVKIFHTI